mgnify:CR=1 FL=1
MFRSMLQPLLNKAALVALALALAAPAPVQADETANTVLSIINGARAKAGCAPLKLNAKLMSAAKSHARAMAEKNFFGHKGKDGAKLGTRAKRQGYSFHMIAENIAAGQSSPGEAAKSWLASSGHRKNILNCKLKDTGIAVAYEADDDPLDGNSKPFHYYWVQIFGAP